MFSLFERVSVYDMLSMVIPGYLVAIFLLRILVPELPLDYGNPTLWIVAFCVSYIIGICVHYGSRIIFGWLGHNQWLADKAYSKAQADISRRRDVAQSGNPATSQENYYALYFKFWGNAALSYIPQMEAQLSFLRSMCVVGVLYSVFGCRFIISSCVISCVVVLTIICFIAIIILRGKIYYYYYEADGYWSIPTSEPYSAVQPHRNEVTNPTTEHENEQ